MRCRRAVRWIVAAGLTAFVTSCADAGKPSALRIDAVRVSEGAAALIVSADVSCAEGSRVQVGESSEVVNLLWLARVGDCSGENERGQAEEITVQLGRPLGGRLIVDSGCAALSPGDPCTITVQP